MKAAWRDFWQNAVEGARKGWSTGTIPRDAILIVFFVYLSKTAEAFSWIDWVFFAAFMLFLWWVDTRIERRVVARAQKTWKREIDRLRAETRPPAPSAALRDLNESLKRSQRRPHNFQ